MKPATTIADNGAFSVKKSISDRNRIGIHSAPKIDF
jgi:hypothetical protein